MTQEEWLKNFEIQNGRPATQEEYTAAWQAGAFTANVSNQVNPEPAKKGPKLGLIIGLIVGVLALLSLAVGGYFFYRYNDGNINGEWRSSSLEQKVYDSIEDGFSEGDVYNEVDLDIKDFVEDSTVALSVKDDKAKVTASYKVDAEGLAKELLSTFEVDYEAEIKSYTDSLDLSDEAIKALEESYSTFMPSQESLQTMIEESMESAAKDEDLDYDKDTGLISGVLLQGQVKRFSKTIEITDYNDNLFDQDFEEGDILTFSKGKDKLSFEMEDDSQEDIDFEKVN